MMDSTTPYREVTEAEATEAGLPAQRDTTYRQEAGETVAYNVGTRTFWKLGRSPFGPDSDETRQRSPVGRAIERAQAALEEAIEAEGGRIMCAVMIVHAEGVTPSGGIDVSADEADGPQDPDDLLAFALKGVAMLAERYGRPFAIMDVPTTGGQG